MNRTKLLYARASATAIAAAFALSSTSVLAQDAQQAQPAPIDSAPAVAPTPAPAAEPTIAPSDTSSVVPSATDSTPAPAVKAKSTTIKRTSTMKRPVHVATAAKPATSVTKSVSRTVATRGAAPAATQVATAAPAAPPQVSQSAVNPIVDVNRAPVSTAQAKPGKKKDDTPIIAAGGALAFLALGGAAVGLSRRKREDEDMLDEQPLSDERVRTAEPAADPIFEQEPAMIAPEASAFSWGARPADQSDRKPGETWVERAYRGPSAENPSLSLRKRLKRAAFFDKRDREVAAGEAQPVEVDAGLPESMAESREPEFA